jgi:alkyl sulfatase BDS1-like metallo-beta-lactamase superfamily hydrolase
MDPSKVPSFDDKKDFIDADRGLCRRPEEAVILDADGKTVWDFEAYSFLMQECPGTANPSLWRQSRLCSKSGLYRVTEAIYQIRGFDISNMTIVQCKNGVIIIDPLISKECSGAGYELYCACSESRFPGKPTKTVAVIYTHSHIDHYGGIVGVLPHKTILPDGTAGVRIIAPDGFMEHAVSENVYAGNAMNRRATYMYGNQIPKGPHLQIGTGLGMTTSSGSNTIIKPTESITETPTQTVKVDGVTIVFQLTPGTEAPSEMNFHFPDLRALCVAENATHTMHNIQTLRGAEVRDAHMWSKYLDATIDLFVADSDVIFASHHWPTWETENIRKFMTSQRDMYAYLNDQTLRMLNEGMTGLEIAETFELPRTLSQSWYNQGYYGSISHNVKAIYNRYMGWFDGNPAHLWECQPADAGKYYLYCMGGVDKVLKHAEEYRVAGNLRFAATLLSHAVFGTSPTHPKAANDLAAVLKQLGYETDNGTWRNFFLVGAYELENGIQPPALGTVDAASMEALDLDQFMDTMAIRLNGPRTPSHDHFTIEFSIIGMDTSVLLTLSNSALTNRTVEKDRLRTADTEDPNLKCVLTHSSLVQLVMGDITINDVHATGQKEVWPRLLTYLTVPDPAFAIVTPEKYTPPEK